MALVRYDGPGHQLEAFGQTVARGHEAEFSEAELVSLQAQPYLRITVIRRQARSRIAPAAAPAPAEPAARTGEGRPVHTTQED